MYTARQGECCVVYYHEDSGKYSLLAVLKVEMGEYLNNVLDLYAERYAFERAKLSGDFVYLLTDWTGVNARGK